MEIKLAHKPLRSQTSMVDLLAVHSGTYTVHWKNSSPAKYGIINAFLLRRLQKRLVRLDRACNPVGNRDRRQT
jgi:hypothetical protein